MDYTQILCPATWTSLSKRVMGNQCLIDDETLRPALMELPMPHGEDGQGLQQTGVPVRQVHALNEKVATVHRVDC
jgi:hypothetical protein